MPNWISVDDQEPPKDRVIEITSGYAWKPKNIYLPASNRPLGRQVTETVRLWQIHGAIMLAYWMTAEETGQEQGLWIAAGTDGAAPQNFRFWREAENPIADVDDLYTSARCPVEGRSEKFVGDARKSELLAGIAAQEKRIHSLSERSDSLNPVIQRTIKNMTDQLPRMRAEADAAFDPPMPPKQ